MAVVQISRIQVRRGKKNAGSGVPQLAGGEFGWAVDTRELYIGNGAVSEGAPAVGNTKVITEHDNLFTLADTYVYKNEITVQTGATATTPIKRDLQSRLDDIISIRSFGAEGDGLDQTAQIQRAIDQLFINASTTGTALSRVVLNFEPGEYVISSTIKVPPFASIIGAGIDKTVFKQSGGFNMFETVNGTSRPGSYADDSSTTSLNQPTSITMSGFTIELDSDNSGGIVLQSCKNSQFENIKVKGSRSTGGSIDTERNAGFILKSKSTLVASNNNIFRGLHFQNMSLGIVSDFDIQNNVFSESKFDALGHGVFFGENTVLGAEGQATGPKHNIIENCHFKDIDREAFHVFVGTDNRSNNNTFEDVGYNGGTPANALYHVIVFDTEGNISNEDWFERHESLSYGATHINADPYKSEIKGPVQSIIGNFNNLDVSYQSNFVTLFRLPGDLNRIYEIDYKLNSSNSNVLRVGKLRILFDPNSTGDPIVSDEFDVQDMGGGNNEKFDFQVSVVDADSDTSKDTIAIKYKNSIINDQSKLSYRVKIVG